MNLNFSPFPVIKTDRLFLRRLTEDDSSEVLFFKSDPEMMRYIHRVPLKSLQQARDYIAHINSQIDKNDCILWGITLPPQKRIIGYVCFWRLEREHDRAEIGYLLHPSFHRKGIMKECLHAVLDYGFNKMKLHSVEADVHPENVASILLLRSLGFRQEGYFRENYLFNGEYLDTVIYSLLKPAGAHVK